MHKVKTPVEGSKDSTWIAEVSIVKSTTVEGATSRAKSNVDKVDLLNSLTTAKLSTLPTPPPSSLSSSLLSAVSVVYSPEELSIKISSLTEELVALSNNGFSHDIINIRIEGHDVPDLCIVDLPGIIRTTTVGQSKSVISEVDSLLESFIKQPRTIILAVIPSNQDVATIDVLERAAKCDPMGSRTIGVLTKPDLVDKGAECEVIQVMKNLRKPLALGYVMVKNRNQNQLNNNLSLSDAMTEESNYFKTHADWSTLDQSCVGVRSLSNRLTKILVHRAHESLPTMISELNDKLNRINDELVACGDEGPVDAVDRSRILLKIISRFGQTLRQISSGEYRDSLTMEVQELRIKYAIKEIIASMQSNLSQKIPNFHASTASNDDTEYIAKQLNELRGRELPGFMSVRLLLATASTDIDLWKVEVENAIARVVEVYMRTSSVLISRISGQYPTICDSVMSVVRHTLHVQSKEMIRRTDELFDGADATLVDDKDFIASINRIRLSRFDNAIADIMDSAKEMRPGKMEKEELKQHVQELLGQTYMKYHSIGYGPSVQIEDIRAALGSYWHAAENRLNDSVANTIDLVLLKDASETIETSLLSLAQNWTYDTNTLDAMLSEEPETVAKRASLKERKHVITQAIDRINRMNK